jgi:phospholipid-binding lipoprotein MlaA
VRRALLSIPAAAILLCGLVQSPALAQTPAVVDQTVAVPPAAVAPGPNPDPWEPFNRAVFSVFQGADRVALRPAAIFYSRATPKPLQVGLRNAFRNLHEPIVFVNDVFQARFNNAGVTLGRLALNSTVGFAGLFDPATGAGLPYHNNGFGTTLGRYGVPPGPYLFGAGPTDVRDAIGSGVDILTDPLTWINFHGRLGFGVSRGVVSALDDRAEADPQLKALSAMSTDEYASLRSLYLQNRAAEITGGQVNVNDLPSFGDEPAGPPNRAGTPGAPPAALTTPGAGDSGALPSMAAPTTTPAPSPTPTPPSSTPHP